MRKYEIEAIGSYLKIEIDTSLKYDFGEIFSLIQEFDNNYSRFKNNSLIGQLNSGKEVVLTQELKTLINFGLKLEKITEGAFDITVCDALETIGYDRDYSFIHKDKKIKYGSENIVIKGDKISLKKGIKLDLGGIGKGYLIDKIYSILDKNFDRFIINFGGDIKCKGEFNVGLQNPFNADEIIGEIKLNNESICASSPTFRKFGDKHHLVNPKNGEPINNKTGTIITHRLATFADGFATSIYLMDNNKAEELIKNTNGIEGVIIYNSEAIYTSENFFGFFYKK